MYLISVFFTLTNNTIQPNYLIPIDQSVSENNRNVKTKPLITLLLVGIGLAVMSEIMTDSIGPTANKLGFSPLFAGIFLLAPVGMVSELINSIRFARQNQLDISLAITMGSSTQIALLVAPLLVFFGLATGQHMDLLFSKFEVLAIILSVVTVNHILQLGSVHWVSGPKLIAIYLILGVAFFNIP
jgi:Ca2+:H+ antiporter